MQKFIIRANESWLYTKDGNKSMCLHHDTEAFYHSDYYGSMGRHNIDGTIENLICTLKNDITPYSDTVLSSKTNQLKQILRDDLLQILNQCGYPSLMVCVIPRAKNENYYRDNQMLFRATVQYTINNDIHGFIDGTHNIKRHTDTRTTHKDKSGYGGNGPKPYCGITNDTCTISNVQGQNVLLIDDLYTKSVGIDEDAIQALYDNGANKVFFYSIGKTVFRNYYSL